MIENEDSVVTSLNELRKLKNERISRQSQSRPISVGNRAVALAEDPLADQLTPPPVQNVAAVVAQAPSAFDQGASFSAPAFAPAPTVVQAPPVFVTKTSYKAAVLMTVLLGGAGAAGYMKVQADSQAALAAKDAIIRSGEDARMRSVEAAAKAEQVTKANLRQCEDKLKASVAAAVAPAAPAAAAVAPSVEKTVEKKAEKTVVTKASRGGHKAARAARQSAPAAREKPEKEKGSGDVPTIAKKKKVDNDPLAGLGKL